MSHTEISFRGGFNHSDESGNDHRLRINNQMLHSLLWYYWICK